ncbi:uncharacterized protein LOC143997770 [Lithobates pipiens]
MKKKSLLKTQEEEEEEEEEEPLFNIQVVELEEEEEKEKQLGHAVATTKMEDKFLRVTSRRNEQLTAQQLREQLNLGQRKQVSLSTVKRRLHAAGLSSWVSVGKPLLKVQMKKKEEEEPLLKVQKKKKVEEPLLKVQMKKKKSLLKTQEEEEEEEEEEPLFNIQVVELEEEEEKEKQLGHAVATTKMEDKFLRVTSRRNEQLTAQQLREQLNLGQRKQVSLSTVKRRLHAAGLSSWVSVGKPLLKVQMKKKEEEEPLLKVQKKKKVEEPLLKVQMKKKKSLLKTQEEEEEEEEEEPLFNIQVVELEEEEKQLGHAVATTKMEDKFLRVTSRRNEQLTAQQLREQLNLGQRKQVSLSTVKRRLNAAGLSSWVSVGKPLLKVQMKKRRSRC